MDLRQYKLQNFLEDKSFQNWVFHSHHEDIDFWNTWLRNHPEKKELAMEAARIIKGFNIKEKQFSYNEVHGFWLELEERLQSPARRQTPHIVLPQRQSAWLSFLKVAAVFAGFLMLSIGAWWYLNQEDTITYATAYGETNTIALPDGSQVTLNGNSELHYLAGWETQPSREVWLKGEAFFEVEKIANTSQDEGLVKFIVHTSSLDIEVVGTSFNVNDRRNATTVVLEEGKVKLQGRVGGRSGDAAGRTGGRFQRK